MVASLETLLYKIGTFLTQGFIKNALTGAGLGLVSYTGLKSLLDKIINDSTSMLYGGDSVVLSILGLGGVDTALSIILSACVIRVTIQSSIIGLTKL